jgi:hypothetical protein
MPRRTLTIFTMSFLDVMSCGFGAIILIYLVVHHGTEYGEARDDRHAEMRKLDFEVQTGQENLSQIKAALETTAQRMDEAKLKRLKILASLLETRNAQAAAEAQTLAQKEALEKLRADVASKEEDVKRLEAKAEASEGQNARSFIGEGNRQYLTGLKIGGEHILIAFDTSASMLDNTIVNVLRRRNMDDEKKKKAPKWVRTVATVEWLAAQFPLESQFQIIGFNESAKTMADGTEGRWIDVSNSKDLERAVSAVKAIVPSGGTNLEALAAAVAAMSPSPDNIFLVTDGLPTQNNGGAKKATVTGRQRVQLFNDAVKKLPKGVPINVILLPLEGDAVASGEFWRLAQATGGTYLSPSTDWP